MKNRAKCKKCNDIIESFHSTDYCVCSCGEIGVDGGDAMRCLAKDWKNFVRVDDNGKEIVPEVVEKNDIIPAKPVCGGVSKEEVISALETMIKQVEGLPSNAMSAPLNHYDLLSVLLLVESLFKTFFPCKTES